MPDVQGRHRRGRVMMAARADKQFRLNVAVQQRVCLSIGIESHGRTEEGFDRPPLSACSGDSVLGSGCAARERKRR